MATEYGLIGQKLGHSFSKTYFTQKFHQEHLDAVYENFELPEINAFKKLMTAHPKLQGLNVTIPYKEAIIPFLHGLSDNARAVGAVNTIQFAGGRLVGHNTDVIGFRDALGEVYANEPGGKALILGTGGSAKAVKHVLDHFFEFEEVWFASRASQGPGILSYPAVNQQGLGGYRLIVNCTPVGMFPHTRGLPQLPYATLEQTCFVFDLVYNPEETRLLREARQRGCPTRNGLEMLMRQAEASWRIWTGNG
jgi:shikimate dehydrogenase